MKMKAYTRILGVSAALPVLFMTAGCSQEQYELQNMVSEDYHKVLGFKNSGILGETLYNVGIESSVDFTVLKGGSDPSAPCSFTIEELSQEDLSVYGSTYYLLPEEYYTLSTNTSESDSVYVASGEPVGVFSAKFTGEQIAKMNENLPENGIYCLAFRINSSDATVNSANSYVIRPISIEGLSFTLSAADVVTDNGLPRYDDLERGSIDGLPVFSVKVDGGLECPFDVNFNIRYRDDLVENYNSENGTFYDKLPADALGFDTDDFTIDKGTNGFSFALVNNAQTLPGAGLYLCPIEVSFTDQEYTISGGSEKVDKGTVYYVVLEDPVALSTTNLWAPFDLSGYDGQGLAGLVDGAILNKMFWHSPYNNDHGEYYNDGKFGHYFQIALSETLSNGFHVQWWVRDDNPTNTSPREIEIYAAAGTPAGDTKDAYDALDWKLIYSESADTYAGTAHPWPTDDYNVTWISPGIDISEVRDATYIRFCVKKTAGGATGIDYGACTCISEFRMWGE